MMTVGKELQIKNTLKVIVFVFILFLTICFTKIQNMEYMKQFWIQQFGN